MSSRILYRVIWVPSLLAIFGMTIAFGRAPATVPQPGTLVQWESGDKSISIMRPENWRAQSMGASGTSMEVWFEPANYCYFGAKSDLAGSLMADIARAPSMGGMEEGEEGGAPRVAPLSPTEKLHIGAAEDLPRKYKGYEEGPTEKTNINGLEAVMTSFTFNKKGLWGERPMAGKRVTMLTTERRMTVFCYCPENLKEILMPVFDQMIMTFKAGEGSQ